LDKLDFRGLSIAEFLHRNPQLAGFENPTKEAYTTIRELVENSLDACESFEILPNINIEIKEVDNSYLVKVSDNGRGVPNKHIPEAFGRVLFGSKYSNQQNRGEMGLGVKMALIMAQIKTRKPFTVISTTPLNPKIFAYVMEIDTKKNTPIIHKGYPKILENKHDWHGTIIKFYSKGDFHRALHTIKQYLRLTSIVCPYANIKLSFIRPSLESKIVFNFKRVTNIMPKPPKVVKYHPHGVDAETLNQLILKNKKDKLLSEFLVQNFQRLGKTIAKKFLVYCEMKDVEIGKLSRAHVSHIAECMKSFEKFINPTASCLSPVGEDILRQGVFVNFEPEYFTYTQRKGVNLGHAYIIEVACAYGGKIISKLKQKSKENIIVYRFANRIPLLYDASSCMFKRVLDSINLNQYKINNDEPVLVIVHICSTKIPYKTVGKEFISSDFEEINHTMRLCYGDVFRGVKDFISKKIKREHSAKRTSVIKKYLEIVSVYTAETLGKEKVNIEEIIK